jgi:hypothetical protein
LRIGRRGKPRSSMSETRPEDRSFSYWYGRTIGRWWIVSQIAAWLFIGGLIPVAYGLWRYTIWASEWSQTHGLDAAARFDATHTWVDATMTKRGRFRRGHWRRK